MTFVLNNVRSAFNVGSAFRSCDALGAGLILVGYTPKPVGKNLDLIKKTAIGSELTVAWQEFNLASEVFEQLKDYQHFAIEIDSTSQSLFEFLKTKKDLNLEKTCFWFGNELYGLNSEVLDFCQKALHLDMLGKKESLNVSSSLCAVGYLLKFTEFLK
jgi:tRNA G18 (ribose-2'-O)-methylase SpoU